VLPCIFSALEKDNMTLEDLIRFLKVLEFLSGTDGVTKQQITEELEVDRRSVERAFRSLEKLGFEIDEVQAPSEREKRWRLSEDCLKRLPDMGVPKVEITPQEVLALYMLRGQVDIFRGSDLKEYAESALQKLSMFISPGSTGQLEGIRALFLPTSRFPKDYAGKEDIIEKLVEAILDRRPCYLIYHSFYDDKENKGLSVDPLYFFEHNSGIYLFANKTDYDEIRVLAVERISHVDIKRDLPQFEPLHHFDPEEWLASAFDITNEEPMNVKVWFSADQARYIKERTWSKSQRFKDNKKDGSTILTMTV